MEWESKWKRLRFHRWTTIGMWLGFLPFGVAVSSLLPDKGAPYAIGAYMAGWLVNHLAAMAFLCPRCDRPFHLRVVYGNPFTRRCLWCGQEFGEEAIPGSFQDVSASPGLIDRRTRSKEKRNRS